MTKRSNRIRTLFRAAVDHHPKDRLGFLKTACEDDSDLFAELSSLLEGHNESTGFLESLVYGEMEIEFSEDQEDYVQLPHIMTGQKIGSYRLLELISEGGMAVVYLAEQDNPVRQVAIKLVKTLAHPEHILRFEDEARLLGRLAHPGIAQIYEAGTATIGSSSQPFVAMEYVKGEWLTKHASHSNLELGERLRLLQRVAEATHYAHQKGIIHRDLKPANILVDDRGQPKILDFGIARSIGDDESRRQLHTGTGQLIGTLQYMSPEQCSGGRDAIDVRADVYALGVIGYELLVGHVPHDMGDMPVVDQIRYRERHEPPLLGSVDNDYRGEVETIIAKAMSIDIQRRYQSAAEFANDLERFLRNEPIQAKADSTYYILTKTLRRYRVHVAVVAAFFLILSISSVLVTGLWLEARSERENARQATVLTQSVLNHVIQEFEDAVRPLAGGMRVSDRVLAQVAVDLAALRPLVETDSDLSSVHAALREKQGDITYAQGNHSEATEHYQTFLAISEKLCSTADSGKMVDYCLNQARGHRKLARVSNEPESHFKRAVELCSRIIEQIDDSVAARHEFSVTVLEHAQYLFDIRRFSRAVEKVDTVIGVVESVVAGLQSTTEDERALRYAWGKRLAQAYSLRGRSLLEIGNSDASLASLESANSLANELVQEQPADVQIHHMLLMIAFRKGIGHYQAERFDEAELSFERAIGIGEYLTKVDPMITSWKIDLRRAHHELSRTYIATSRPDSAAIHSQRAIAIAQEFVQAEAENSDWKQDVANSKLLAGYVHLSEKQWESANDMLRQAEIIYRSLLETDPENLALKFDFAYLLDGLGKCAKKLGQSQASFEYYTGAYETRLELYKIQPELARRILDVVLSETKLATWHQEQKTIVGDQTAADILKNARMFMLEQHELGKLQGHQRKFDRYLKHIDDELTKITLSQKARKKVDGAGI